MTSNASTVRSAQVGGHRSVSSNSPATVLRSGTELIRATKAFAKDNAVYSWWAFVSTGLIFAVAWAAAVFSDIWYLRLCAAFVAGLSYVRFFCLYHDHQHHAILPKSKTMRVLMRAWGIIGLAPNSTWSHSHNYHHAHNSQLHADSIGSFPVMTLERFESLSRVERWRYLINRHPLTILCGYAATFLYAMCWNSFREDPRKHRDCLFALVLHAVLYIGMIAAFGWAGAFFGVFLPFAVAGAVGTYLFYAQHSFPGVKLEEKNNGWTFEGAALESSSFCKMGPLMRYFTANIGYHHIHHLNHKIPFYRLPEAFRAMPELQRVKTTSLRIPDIRRCLSLKVWCTATRQLVPIR
ncbi:MAG: fatty acid desaturase family protein [Opitutales bacterium]